MISRFTFCTILFFLLSVVVWAQEEPQPIWKTKTVKQWEKVLESAIQNPSSDVSIPAQWYAVYALGQYGPEAASSVPVLLKRLDLSVGKDDDVKACILYTLAQIGDPQAFPAISSAVDSEYPTMQRTAALALRKFPDELKKSDELLKKMKEILTLRDEMQFALASNCAAALWGVGEKETVLNWLAISMKAERSDKYSHYAELYQALAAIHQILEDAGPDAFEEETPKLAAELAQRVSDEQDQDCALSMCEILTFMGPAVVEAVQTQLDSQEKSAKNPRLTWVLASIDAENEKTQNFLLELVSDSSASLLLRTMAIRGLQFFPESRRQDASSALVTLLNNQETNPTLANEARLTLRKF